MSERCDNCRFHLDEDGKIYCRRNPPQVFGEYVSDGEAWRYVTVFPMMQPSGWCGEWKATPN